MKQADFPLNEQDRLLALDSYCVLDTQSEASFDRITELASRILKAPVALVSLVDADRQWFKSRVGVEATETPRKVAFCAHAILSEQVFHIHDATQDDRFADNPLVTGPPYIRTYLGAPLVDKAGYILGTLCVTFKEVTPISDEQIAILQNLASIVVDELELKKSIAALEEAHENVRRQASELDKSSQTLAQLSEKLKYEIDVKDRFFNILAHDLRSPFNNLLGLSEVMITMGEKFSKEGMIDFAQRINRSGKDAFALVENLLEWARVQMHGERVDQIPTSVDREFAKCIEQCREIADNKGVHLTYAEARCVATMDPPAFRTIMRNLIANAVKFSQKGQTISLSSREEADEIIVTVSDEGAGIPADVVPNLFRIDIKTTSEGTEGESGTGLGLPLCAELVEQLGGKIWVDSVLGKGSQFHFSLPKAI